MDHSPGDMTDPTGNNRVPAQEQKVFIFTHYPMDSQPSAMISKLYEMYDCAFRMEQAAEEAKNAYKNPKK